MSQRHEHMKPSFRRSSRSPASPRSKPPNRTQLDENIARRWQPSPSSNRSAATTKLSLPRRESRIPTSVRQSPGIGHGFQTGSIDDVDTANSTPGSGRQARQPSPRLSHFDVRRSSTASGYETSVRKDVASSRIPRSALYLETLDTPATSDSAASSPRKPDKSRHSSRSPSPALTLRDTARKTQRRPTTDKIVSRKSHVSPSGASSTPEKNETPKNSECLHAEPSPRDKQEQSPADLIIKAFASAPLRSRPSLRSKAAVMQQTEPRTKTAQTANRAETQTERRWDQQLRQTEIQETSLSLPVGDTSPRQLAASKAQRDKSSYNTSTQSPRSLSPAPKMRGSTTATKRAATTTTPARTSGSVEAGQASPRITDEPGYPEATSGNKISRQSSPSLSPAPKKRFLPTKSKRQPATTTTPTTMSDPVEGSQTSSPISDEPDHPKTASGKSGNSKISRQSSPSLSPAPKARGLKTKTRRQLATTTSEQGETSPRVTDETDCPASIATSMAAEQTTASVSPRNRLELSKIPKSSSTSKTCKPPSRPKRQDATTSKSSPKAKSLSDTEKPTPSQLSTATGAISTVNDHRQNQLPSSTKRESKSSSADVDSDLVTESPSDLLLLIDEDDGHATGVKRKTSGSVTSKQTDAREPSTSRTDDDDDDDDDEAEIIAEMVDKLKQRLEVDDSQLAPSQQDDEARSENGVALSSDVLGSWPTAAATAMDVDDIMAETFPPRLRKSRRRAKSHGRPAAPERDRTWTIADNDPTLQEYSDGNQASLTGPPRIPQRDGTWTKDSPRLSVKYGDEVRDAATWPLRQTFDVGLDTSPPIHDGRKLETPVSDPKADSRGHQVSRRGSVEDDKAKETMLPRCHKTSNIAANSDVMMTVRFPVDHSPPHQLPPLSSVTRNSEPRDATASFLLSHTDIEVNEDDFEQVEGWTDEHDEESTARKMHMRWAEIVEGYTTMLARCHRYASDSTMARRLTELRQKTATLIDAQKRLYGAIDPEIMHPVESMQRGAEQLGRNMDTAGSEPGRRQWMIRLAESELLAVGKVALALKQYCDDIADRNTCLYYDADTTSKTSGK